MELEANGFYEFTVTKRAVRKIARFDLPYFIMLPC